MAVAKFAVSFDPTLAATVRATAEEEGSTVSAWLADAAAHKLRLRTGRAALAAYEHEHGEITEEEIAQAEAQWPA